MPGSHYIKKMCRMIFSRSKRDTATARVTLPRERRPVDVVLSSAGWLVVVACALSLSAWSLYFVARVYGLPVPLAAIVSASFDGAAIVCADLALRYARTHGDSGLGPRLGVLILAGLSAYLNQQHAVIVHDPFAARILYAVPPITAVTLFEFHSRYERRASLRRAGRVAQALPVYGRWAWLFFPIETMRSLRRVISSQLEATETSATVSGSFVNPGGTTDPRVIREWARGQRMSVGERGPIPPDIMSAYELATSSNGKVV